MISPDHSFASVDSRTDAGCRPESAFVTATAVSALSVFRNTLHIGHHQGRKHYRNIFQNKKPLHTDLTASELQIAETLIRQGTAWLIAHQNADGGWGKTDNGVSDVPTALLAKAALILSDVYLDSGQSAAVQGSGQIHDSRIIGWSMDILRNADGYLRRAGGIETVKRSYGKDPALMAAVLMNTALAGLIQWKEVPQLPFEQAAFPLLFRFCKGNTADGTMPVFAAAGLVRFFYLPEKNQPILSFVRHRVRKRTLRLLEKIQPENHATSDPSLLTAFIVMSLSAMGLLDHPAVTKGIRFLLQAACGKGS